MRSYSKVSEHSTITFSSILWASIPRSPFFAVLFVAGRSVDGCFLAGVTTKRLSAIAFFINIIPSNPVLYIQPRSSIEPNLPEELFNYSFLVLEGAEGQTEVLITPQSTLPMYSPIEPRTTTSYDKRTVQNPCLNDLYWRLLGFGMNNTAADIELGHTLVFVLIVIHLGKTARVTMSEFQQRKVLCCLNLLLNIFTDSVDQVQAAVLHLVLFNRPLCHRPTTHTHRERERDPTHADSRLEDHCPPIPIHQPRLKVTSQFWFLFEYLISYPGTWHSEEKTTDLSHQHPATPWKPPAPNTGVPRPSCRHD